MEADIENLNTELEKQKIKRELKLFNTGGKFLDYGTKKLLNFGSNDYLANSYHPGTIKEIRDSIHSYGIGGQSSRLICGTTSIHKELEIQLAKLKDTQDAIAYSSGYLANLGVISSVIQKKDVVMMDRLNHASLFDAVKLSGCRIFVYDYSDMHSFLKIIKRVEKYDRRWLISESLFSMDGTCPPLDTIVNICQKNKIWTIIDDAHATGVLGETGKGALEYFQIQKQVNIITGTLSKAVGAQGGFVCGSKSLKQYLINKSRNFIYTTALSPVLCHASIISIKRFEVEKSKRQHLASLSKLLKNELFQIFPKCKVEMSVHTPIIPLITKDIEKTEQLSQYLMQHGIYAPSIKYPTVRKEQCRIRFSLRSDHTFEDISKLILTLRHARSIYYRN